MTYNDAVSARRKTRPRGGGRYDLHLISARITQRRKQLGIEAKEIYAAMGLEKWDWSRKLRLDGSSFTIEELGKIAEILYPEGGTGWPFIDAALSEFLDRHLGKK